MDEIYLPKKYARSHQLDNNEAMEQALRLYRNDPHSINVIIYTNTAKRRRCTIANITRKEALEIATYLNRKALELSDE